MICPKYHRRPQITENMRSSCTTRKWNREMPRFQKPWKLVILRSGMLRVREIA